MLLGWLRSWLKRQAIPARSRRPCLSAGRARIGWLERLEDRLVPSTFTETEPNDTLATANAVTIATGDVLTVRPSDWLTVNGSLAGKDIDNYQFTIAQRSGVFLSVLSRANGLSATLDSTVAVFDPSGKQLAFNDNGFDFLTGFPAQALAPDQQAGPDASLYLDLNPGTYLVQVGKVAGSGDYQLRMLADSNYRSQPPALDSLKGAPATLYLDCGGHSSSTDYWAKQVPGGSYSVPAVHLAGMGFAGKPGEFTPAEQLLIFNAWRVTSEDLSPFNINVSTDYAGSYGNGTGFDMVVSSSDGSIFGRDGETLGVAPLGVFGSGAANVNVGQVFVPNHTDTFGDDSNNSARVVGVAKEVGDTISHEFGHALGLSHYAGANARPNAIMSPASLGLTYATWQAVPGFQDDMAVIASPANKFGYRLDEHGNTLSSATALTAAGGVYSASGVIEHIDDIDAFRFTASGTTTIDVTTDPYVTDLGPRLRLYDASGNVLAEDAPANWADPMITRELAAGTYYVDVRGSGEPGNAGRYKLEINTSSADNVPPSLDLGAGATNFTQGGGPVLIAPAATVSDPDSPVFLDGALTVSMPAGASPDDRLFIQASGAVGVRGDQVMVGGVTIGSFFGGGDGSTPLVVSLNANATQDATQQLIRAIAFNDVANVPTITPRSVRFVLSDGNGGTSNPAAKIVTITDVNAPPVLAANAPLVIAQGGTGTITNNLLHATDPDNNADQLVFTLQLIPAHGSLQLNGVGLAVGATFTQADIDAGGLAFVHDGSAPGNDGFRFTVADGAGGTIPPTDFHIIINPPGPGPILLNDTGLTAGPRSKVVITPAMLQAVDMGGSMTNVIFSVIAGPGSGILAAATATPPVPLTQFSQSDISQGNVVYLAPATLPSAPTGFTFTLENSHGITSGPFAFPIMFAAGDPDPSLPDGPTPPLNDTYENETGGAGTLVSELLAGSGLPGLAVVHADTMNGSWQYTTDGRQWQDLGPVSDNNARLLLADFTTAVRFLPTPNYVGGVTLTYRAWDGMTGQPGGLGDTQAAGHQSAFSPTTATSMGRVVAVNQAPSFRAGPALTVTTTAGAQSLTGWASQIQDPSLTGGLTFTVHNEDDEVPNANIVDGPGLHFLDPPHIDANGTLHYTLVPGSFGTGTFSVCLKNAGSDVHGGSNTSAAQLFTITVTATPSQRLTSDVYRDLLGRGVDLAGLAYWSGLIDRGTDHTVLVRAIENTPEYRLHVVDNLFRQYLHRPADPAGDAYFANFMAQGQTAEQVAALLIGSAEYYQVRGGGSDAGFLGVFYQDSLGRAIDPSGLASFLQLLAQHTPRSRVAAIVLGSPEYLQDLVSGYYQALLGRGADPGGLSSYVSALQAGARDEDIIAALLGSAEKFANA